MDVREQTLKGKMARVIEFYIHTYNGRKNT